MADLHLVVRGVVHLTTPDQVHVAGPGDIVDSTILGPERVQVLLADGAICSDLKTPLQSARLSETDRRNAEQAVRSARGMA